MTSNLLEKLAKLARGGQVDIGADVVPIRHQNSSGKLSKSELKNEAFEIIFQNLIQNDFPICCALNFAAKVLRDHSEALVKFTVSASQVSNHQRDHELAHQEEPAHQNEEHGNRIPEHQMEQYIDSSRFSVSVLESFRQVCRDFYSTPDKVLEHEVDHSLYEFCVCAAKNNRRKMEDRHVIVPNLKLIDPKIVLNSSAFFAVFDGHGGQECASYAATHLLGAICEALPEHHQNPTQAMKIGFEKCEECLLARCQRDNLRSGTTAVCALLAGKMLYLAWVGDSQAALIENGGNCRSLTCCHDTKNEAECSAVAQRGGILMNIRGENRVNGVINVTRSLGDEYLKPPLSADAQMVEILLTGSEDMLILGCDGLWDGISMERCGQVVRQFVLEHQVEHFDELAKCLVNEARSNDVSDNITCLVILLKTPQQLKELMLGFP